MIKGYYGGKLYPYKKGYSKTWNNTDTIVVRVPRKYKEDILEYAHNLDNDKISYENLKKEILNISKKIDAKERGYKSNSAGECFKYLRLIVKMMEN